MQKQQYQVGRIAVPAGDDPTFEDMSKAVVALLDKSEAEDDTAFGMWLMPVADLLYVAVNGELFGKEEV
jgi:hypothetical protein